MISILVLIHVSVCIALILIVLLQTGKGADMGAAFGGSSQALFGSSGATSFMHKVTAAIAALFVLTCMALTLLFGKGDTSSVMEGLSQSEEPVAAETAIPVAPETQESSESREEE